MKVFVRFIIVIIVWGIVNGISQKIFGKDNVFMYIIIGVPFTLFAFVYAISGADEDKK